eukprot:CAMPEP_0185850094 /NCGR_PEP_ID=MMETSP1354-20130828/4356_1 /TAXON_ID=708628 /ORGANISM="Erythrolobus madagascarensis, Strain CCMP3276" /LENGTH=178 /DNA_ID=CAMNT_0028550729 /DNA_START=212 /DNA_END=749 /DNA_ORIENTATION=-
MGNKYYLEYEGQGKRDKRSVEFASSSNRDHKSLPTEWWSWLHYSRDEPPTEEELIASERSRRNLEARVQEMESIDRAQRLQQQLFEHDATGEAASRNAPSDPSALHLLVRQSAEQDGIVSRGAGEQVTKQDNNLPAPDRSRTGGGAKNETEASYQPEGWNPTSGPADGSRSRVVAAFK